MKKVRILHCADLHFDTPFKELSREISERSKEELLEVFSRIINLTIEEKIEVLLIAGDVFDNLTVNKNTLFFISNELEKIKNVKVFISPGNHDPYNQKSFYNMIDWPENVHIFKGKMQSIEVKELNLVVWGAGFNDKYVNKTLIENLNLDKSKINIMILHGEIQKGKAQNEYNPIYLSDIEKSNMDYIALGHRHNFSGIQREGTTSYAYSGCPQGRGFDEYGEKGVIIGDVYVGGVSLEFVPLCKRIYVTKEIDISSSRTYQDVVNEILKNFSCDERKNNLFKIILNGKIKEEFIFNENILKDKIKNEFYFFKIINKTCIDVDLQELSQDYSIKGKFVSKLMELIENASEEEKEILNMALKLGIQSLSEEEVKLNDY